MSGDPALIDAVSAHVSRHVGRTAFVFHELESELVHIDVHYVRSTRGRPFEVLVTSGMSARPMSTPAGSHVPRYAELVALLPAGWPLLGPAGDDERNSWPLELIRDLARYPHRHKTWLGYGHSLSDADGPGVPFASNTRLSAVILLPPVTLGGRFFTLRRRGGCNIHFWAVVPLYREELEFKLREGTEALLDAFERHGITDVIDPQRTNVARAKPGPEVGIGFQSS